MTTQTHADVAQLVRMLREIDDRITIAKVLIRYTQPDECTASTGLELDLENLQATITYWLAAKGLD